jgi:putative hydroxymethylpyrimidine transport system substrate-binding protein
MSRRLSTALLCLALVPLAAGCGDDEEKRDGGGEPFELLLDFTPNADHAGIYAAQAGGHFRDEGLDVRIRTPPSPSAPIEQTASGRVDLAISYEPEVLIARSKGRRVISVGAVAQRPLTSIQALPGSGVTKPADLAGKRVGTAGIEYQSAFLKAILNDTGAEPEKVVDVQFGLNPALLSRKVDATFGSFYNYEGVELEMKGRDPVVIPADRAGIPTYDELVLVTSEEKLAERRDRIRRFIAALERGTRDLERDPAAAIDALLRADRSLDRKLQEESVKVSLRDRIFQAPPGRPYGWQEPSDREAFAKFMNREGLVKSPEAKGSFTNELLPGAP